MYGNLQIKGTTRLTDTNVLATGTLLQEGDTYLSIFPAPWALDATNAPGRAAIGREPV